MHSTAPHEGRKGWPTIEERKQYFSWSSKRERYINLTVLGPEAFDVASSNDAEFQKVHEYLGSIISKNNTFEYVGSTCHKAEDQPYHFIKASVHDPPVVTNKGAPRKNVEKMSKVQTNRK